MSNASGWQKIGTLLLLIVFICGLNAPLVSAAITGTELNAIYTDSPYYDPLTKDVCAVAGSTVPSQSGGTLTNGSSVYILGDSITVRTEQAYISAFLDKGVTAVVDGSTSRSITGGGITGNKLSGLAAVEQDKTAIGSAQLIIVALGTNGNNDAANVDILLNAIHNHNPSAPLYWVDTTVIQRPGYQTTVVKTSNTAIHNAANDNKITGVIPWFNTVSPDSDPTNPTGTEPDTNAYVEIDGSINAHPTAAGVAKLAELVVNTVSGGAPTTAPTGDTCLNPADGGGGGGGGSLEGADNAAKVYNYLIGKGLTPVQAAGFMGNLWAEAHFEPRLVQYGHINCRGEKSVAGQPSSLCDTLVVDGQTGYGIAQWTSAGRQQNLINFAASKSTIAGDLATQLDFLWQELNTTLKGSVLTPLLVTPDLRTATDIVLRHFECPKACADLAKNNTPSNQAAYQSVLNDRFGLAQTVLTQLGSSGGTP